MAVTYTFSPSTVAKSAEVNQNFADTTSDITGAMPSGGIIMWSGAIVDIPSGWNICDGTNGTPDLRDRFVIGAGSTYAVDDIGGSDSVNLQHSHTVNGHTHSIAHTHNYSTTTGTESAQKFFPSEDGPKSTADSSHTHSVNGTTAGASSASSGSSSPGTNNALSTSQSILPPYYALAYIMKL